MSKLFHKHAHKLIQREQLSAQERDVLAHHLAQCESCQRYMTMHIHLSQNLQLDPARMRPTPKLRATVRRQVLDQKRRQQIMKPIQVVTGVTVLFIVIVVGLVLLNRPPQTELEPVASMPTLAPTSIPAP